MSDVRKAKIREYIEEIWVRGNLDVVDDFYATDYVRYQPPLPDVNGAEAMKQWITSLRDAYSGLQLTIDEFIREGETVVLRGNVYATHTGQSPTLAIPATGRQVKIPWCSVFQQRNSKVVEEWYYADNLGLLQQLGVIPAFASA
jgi:predicted ester cyclase